MNRPPLTRLQLAGYLLCPPLYIALLLIFAEAALSATTTYLVINVAVDIGNQDFFAHDLFYILASQIASYLAGAASWIFSEKAGCRAFGLYMFRFAEDNRNNVKLLNEKATREHVEPFLTSETFFQIFNMMYEVQHQLGLLLGLVLTTLVLGMQIDKALPIAYFLVFVILALIQLLFNKRVRLAYLQNQRMSNRVIAQGYTAWDNVLAGNRYNLRLWFADFKSRLRDCLRAEIREISWREGLSAGGGIIGLLVVFATMVFVATQDGGNTSLLIALAVTVPRQIDMANELHQFVTGWNDVLAHWTRWGGVVANMRPVADPNFDARIQFDRLIIQEDHQVRECRSVEEALRLLLAQPTGRINLRGGNASGKSTLLASLKSRLKPHSYFWPTADRLSFSFERLALSADVHYGDKEDEEEDGSGTQPGRHENHGFSSGERMLQVLKEIVDRTDDAIYLLDEWDANLDAAHRTEADALVDKLAARARVIEISHRDKEAARRTGTDALIDKLAASDRVIEISHPDKGCIPTVAAQVVIP